MKVCVIIPIYQEKLTPYETISLSQAMVVLGHYPIKVIKPKLLNISYLQEKYSQVSFENFDDAYFKSTLSYNRLLLSEEFYSRFLAYEFMLIHQLDVFVFRDELNYWCQQGYDYIGPPWRIEIDFDSKLKEFAWNVKKKIALWFDLKEELHGRYGPKEIIMKRAVGNGGFSLRRTKKLLGLIPANQKKIDEYLEKVKTHPAYNEDMFWGIEMNRYVPQLNIPDWRTALRFGVEHLPKKAYSLNGGLPFGCHAWDIYETDFWKVEIEKLGYKF